MKKQLSDEEIAFQDHSSLQLGRCIYNGDAERVYLLQGYPNRVVKIIGGHSESAIRPLDTAFSRDYDVQSYATSQRKTDE
jgi:hypothetical protein